MTTTEHNAYPVDSTYYPCCRAIGRHGHECRVRRLDDAVSRIDAVRRDINDVVRAMPDKATPMAAVTDIATALVHLRNAALRLDQATDCLDAEAAAQDCQR